MANQTGIAFALKGFMPLGKSIDEQLEALGALKAAHESGDYSAILPKLTDVEVSAEQKTRRVKEEAGRGNLNLGNEGGAQGSGGSGEAPTDPAKMGTRVAAKK